MEIWKEIPKYEGYYEISNYGNVRTLDRVIINSKGVKSYYGGKVRKPSVNEYRIIILSKNGTAKGFKISRLVALLFVGGGNSVKNIVNHIDGNKLNDHYENLEWCTTSYNIIHSFENGMSSKKNEVPGVFYDKKRNKWASYLYRDNKNIFIGRFNTEQEAINKRKIAEDDYKLTN
jgi:hypothetical protein